jgi:hypothetical protein
MKNCLIPRNTERTKWPVITEVATKVVLHLSRQGHTCLHALSEQVSSDGAECQRADMARGKRHFPTIQLAQCWTQAFWLCPPHQSPPKPKQQL